jgi:hypothetical protein
MNFNLAPLTDVANLFGNCSRGIAKKDVIQIRVGLCVVLWAMRVVRNDLIFNKPKAPTSCRLSLCTFIGLVRGLISNQWSSAMLWILGEAAWRW